MLDTLKKEFENRSILEGFAKKVYFDEELGTDVIIIDYDGVDCVIKREEVDMTREWKSLTSFIGRMLTFKIIEIDEENNRAFCSRKEAQSELSEDILSKLNEGESFTGKIINLLHFGAYVEIEGLFSGLLKNPGFSADYTAIEEVKKLGDEVVVKGSPESIPFEDMTDLKFEASEKYTAPEINALDEFKEEQVVFGKVKTVHTDKIFVNIATGFDALCSHPEDQIINEGDKVRFKITQIKGPKKVRGRIV